MVQEISHNLFTFIVSSFIIKSQYVRLPIIGEINELILQRQCVFKYFFSIYIKTNYCRDMHFSPNICNTFLRRKYTILF